MPKKATVVVHPSFKIGEISPRLYGAFLEPIGTMVNGSMFNPKQATADEKGFRRDYINALKDTGLPRSDSREVTCLGLELEGLHWAFREKKNSS